MKSTGKITTIALAAIAAVAMFLVAFPAVNAQGSLGFGTKVSQGDNDFLPTLTATAPAALTFCRVALGDTALVTDDGLYVMAQAPVGAGALPTNAIRINTVLGKAPGTLTTDADTTEVGKACVGGAGGVATDPTPAGVPGAVAIGDIIALSFDAIATYSSGDCVYLSTGLNGAPGATIQRWDVRLTMCKIGATTYNAGTLVELGDQDLQNAPGAIAMSAAAVWAWWDSQPNGVLDTSDRVYITRAAPSIPLQNDVRILGTTGQFGSFVKFGDSDFVPTIVAFAAPLSTLVNFCQVALGDTSLVTDDGLYIYNGAIGVLPTNAVRLNTVLGKAPGTLTGDADTTEVGKACVGGATTTSFAPYAAAIGEVFSLNFDAIPGYTVGDCVYMKTGLTAAGATLQRWDVRLTMCKIGATTYNAGSLVELGDLDLQNAPAVPTGFAGGWGFWDNQPNNALDTGDRLYASGSVGGRPGVNDVRLLGSTGQYGSLVKNGDNDFRPTMIAPPGGGMSFCLVALGDTSTFTDDGYYLVDSGTVGAATLPVNAVRLNTVLGKAAGTMTGDADTTEVGKACADPDLVAGGLVAGTTAVGFAGIGAGAINVYALSFDAIGTYTSGDCVYLDLGLSAAVTGVVDRWDLRLSECKIGATTYNAGTLVELGDHDLQNAPASITLVVAGSAPSWNLWDSQPNGFTDNGDLLYASTTAVAAGKNPALNDVRLFGSASAIVTPGGTTSPGATTPGATTPGATTPGATTPGATTPGATTPGATTPGATGGATTPTSSRTPGFELVAILGGLAVAAAVIVRRKAE